MTTSNQSLSKHPTNPLVIARELHALSQDDLANSAGITKQIVTTAEAGVFEDIPRSILDALEYDFGVNRDTLNNDYRNWVKQELSLINVLPVTLVERISIEGQHDRVKVSIPVGVSTFRQWRAELCKGNGVSYDSLSGFGKLIKIQPVTIRKYESGRTKSLPGPLVGRLRFWGFPEEYLSQLAGLPIGGRIK